MILDVDIFNPATTIMLPQMDIEIITYLFRNPRKTITEIYNGLNAIGIEVKRDTVYRCVNKLAAKKILMTSHAQQEWGGNQCATIYTVNRTNTPYIRWPKRKYKKKGQERKTSTYNNVPQLADVVKKLIEEQIIVGCDVNEDAHTVTLTFAH